jgi:phosphatidylethanolamine/phosphatidyl-N-methylethanolamine N-methyltransferase
LSLASLRASYRIWAPVYDALLRQPFRRQRQLSLRGFAAGADQRILVAGIGTGLDLEHLPRGADYSGIDLTWGMLRRARARAERLDFSIQLAQGDVMALPYPDNAFDHILMHLILAVAPDARRTLLEATRVLRPGGSILVLDKFLRPGQRAPLRRSLNHLIGPIATHTDLVLESLLQAFPELRLLDDRPAGFDGWFRCIKLGKEQQAHVGIRDR